MDATDFREKVIGALARIDTKLDAALKQADDHERRVRALEKSRWMLAGAASVAGAVLAQFAPKIIGGST